MSRISEKLKVAILSDDVVSRDKLVAKLSSNGYSVTGDGIAANGQSMTVRSFQVSIVVLDFSTSGAAHMQVIKHLRAAYPAMGIVVISSPVSSQERFMAYHDGADIHLASDLIDGIDPELLLAAVNSLAERISALQVPIGKIVLNVNTLQLHGPVASIDVAIHELRILAAFANAEGRRLDTNTIIEMSDKAGVLKSKATLEVQLVRLRKKLIAVGATDPCIKALRGFGYQLCAPVTVRDPSC